MNKSSLIIGSKSTNLFSEVDQSDHPGCRHLSRSVPLCGHSRHGYLTCSLKSKYGVQSQEHLITRFYTLLPGAVSAVLSGAVIIRIARLYNVIKTLISTKSTYQFSVVDLQSFSIHRHLSRFSGHPGLRHLSRFSSHPGLRHLSRLVPLSVHPQHEHLTCSLKSKYGVQSQKFRQHIIIKFPSLVPGAISSVLSGVVIIKL